MLTKENIGIPVGTDPGPDFAKLFLHFYEFNVLECNTKTKYITCKKFSNFSETFDNR